MTMAAVSEATFGDRFERAQLGHATATQKPQAPAPMLRLFEKALESFERSSGKGEFLEKHRQTGGE